MRKFAVTLLLFVGILSRGADALNLTPLRIVTSNDGPPQERYFFQDTTKRLAFRIDHKMTVSGSADLAIFRFADFNPATMRLLKSPAPVNLPLDQKGLEIYQTVARAMLPPDAANVQLVQTIPDAISINGWKSAQFIYTYALFGSTYRRSIAFLNFNETEQFVFDVSARVDDYDKVYSRGYRVLNSLFELPLSGAPGPS